MKSKNDINVFYHIGAISTAKDLSERREKNCAGKAKDGGAAACPFSPYSDINVRDTSLRKALKSPLFLALQEEGVLLDDHTGGCVLHEKRAEVERLLQAQR